MRKNWIRWGRLLWVLLAVNSVYVFGLTLWVTFQFLEHPSERLVQGLSAQGLSLGVYGALFVVSISILFFVYFIVALLIFLRRPDDGFALFAAIFLLNYGAANAYPTFAEFLQFYQNPPWWYGLPALVCALFSWTLLAPFLFIYPDGHFAPRWAKVLAAYSFILTFAWSVFPGAFADPTSPLGIFGALSAIFLTGASFYVQVWRYRHYASLTQRQQIKWFVFALAIFFVFTVLIFVLPLAFNGEQSPAASIWSDITGLVNTVTPVFIPIAVGFAILRYRLWDIDVIIRKTVTYTLVVVLLVIVYFSGVILLQQSFSTLTGLGQNEIVTVVSTLGIAALFVPLRNRIQTLIDRRFYRKKYDAQQVLNDFAKLVRDETDLEQLTGRLIQVVDETMQPQSLSVWLRGVPPGAATWIGI